MSIARVASAAACCAAVFLAVFLAATLAASQPDSSRIQQIPRDQWPASRGQMPPRVGTASVHGRVLDGATGMPLPRARVRLMGGALGRGGDRPMSVTDGQGRFSFTGLPAGPIMLSAEKSTYLTASFPESGRTIRSSYNAPILKDGEALEITLRLYHGGAIAGRVVDSQGDLVEGANIQALRVSQARGGRMMPRTGNSSNDIGEFRLARLDPGSYLLMASPRGRAPDDPSESQSILTFYPGVASVEEAQPITIERGQAVSGIELTLLDGTPSVVSGSVIDATGQPVTTGAYVNTRLVTKDFPTLFTSFGGGASVKPDGTFQVRLTPGEYDFDVTAMSPGVIGGGPVEMRDQQVGSVRVTIPAGPVSDVLIRLGRPGTVSGRLVFEGTSPLPKNPQQVNIGISNMEGSMCRSNRSQVGADWTFTIDGVFGTCTLMAMGATGQWTLKSITRGSDSFMDRPFSIRPGQDIKNVVVTFTDKRTEITLKVTDEAGQPTSEYVALAFPVDKDRWTTNSRYIQTFTPPPPLLMAFAAQQSTSSSASPGLTPATMRREGFNGLPPGEYYVVAVDDMEREATRDPAVLAELAASATKVTLVEGSPVVVSLRLKKFM